MKRTFKPRKKVCTKCGRRLWLRDFYKEKGRRRSWCKDCDKKRARDRYTPHKVPDGVRYRESSNRMEEHKKGNWYIVWSDRMIYELKRFYPNTTNDELADLLNVSVRTICRKAKELGLNKDKEWMRQKAREASLMARPINKERRLNHDF